METIKFLKAELDKPFSNQNIYIQTQLHIDEL